MGQRLHVITIGADNCQGMVNFYTQILGWKPAAENADIVFFKLNGFFISIVQRQLLANFIGIPFIKKETSFLTLGYTLSSKEEVIDHYEDLKRKNVRILKEPVESGQGACFFYFADIEDNIFEVACNPYIVLDENDNVISYTYFDD
jgi:hypothetical protein